MLVALGERNETLAKSFANFGNVDVALAKDLNPVSLLSHKFVMFVAPEASVAALAKRAGAGKEGEGEPATEASEEKE